jgi:propanol-preferring alcohol dehydrogenase
VADVQALRLNAWKSEAELVEVPEPEPVPGQVVIRIGGAGACHSDLHLMSDFDDGMVPWKPPFTLGHENAGWIHALGHGVEGWDVGTPVAVFGSWGCGRCARCRTGAEAQCEDPAAAPVPGGGGGLGLDGGMAEYMLVPDARHLLRLPEGMAPADAAPLTDAGLTTYHAVGRSRSKLGPRAVVVIIGIGGLGHVGVQIVKATTAARVVAVDTRPEALELARRCGADETLPAGPTAPDEIRRLTGGLGADVVVDCVGTDATLALGAAALRSQGDLTIVGIGGGVLPVSFFSLPSEATVASSVWGTRPELAEVLELGARGLVTTEHHTVPLSAAAQAYRDLRAGLVEGRVVVVP